MIKGLVLAGGGAKGSYQVGVWRALQELGWRPDIITGTSVGSLNGAMFVLDLYEVARDMWLTIDGNDVMTLPEERRLNVLSDFLQDVVKGGGLDVSPLESIIDRVLDEDALRAAPTRFGLVTVEYSKEKGPRARELPLEEIPRGKVKDYLLASAACFPAFRPREIDGAKFIDGGYADNMPFRLAQRMGAEELVCVDIDGLGLTRPNLTRLPTTVIESHWDLGELLRFDPAAARRNMELGYYDALRAFGRVRGTAYALRLEDEQDGALFRTAYNRTLARCVAANPSLALAEKAAVALFGPRRQDKALAPLELAAEEAGVDPTRLYTVEELRDAFLAAYAPEKARRYEKLLYALDTHPGTAALAAVTPRDFVAAVLYAALTGAYEPEPLPAWAGELLDAEAEEDAAGAAGCDAGAEAAAGADGTGTDGAAAPGGTSLTEETGPEA